MQRTEASALSRRPPRRAAISAATASLRQGGVSAAIAFFELRRLSLLDGSTIYRCYLILLLI